MSSSMIDLLARVEQYPEIFESIVQSISKKNCKIIQIGLKMILHNSLYHKYNQSEHFYYIRAFNDIYNNAPTPTSIAFRDLNVLDTSEEYFKRQYKITEFNNKMNQLIEYYKFHNDIPRIFLVPSSNTLNRYYDKKRKIQYFKIVRLIEEENKRNPN